MGRPSTAQMMKARAAQGGAPNAGRSEVAASDAPQATTAYAVTILNTPRRRISPIRDPNRLASARIVQVACGRPPGSTLSQLRPTGSGPGAHRHEEEVADLVPGTLDCLEFRHLAKSGAGGCRLDAALQPRKQRRRRQDIAVRFQGVEKRARKDRVSLAAGIEHRLVAAR